MRRFKAVLKKEFAHIFRDPVSLSIILVMPILMIIIYGYSINFDLKEVRTGIVDLSLSNYSKKLIKKFQNNKYFVLMDLAGKEPVKRAEEKLRKGELNQYLIIPANFSKKSYDVFREELRKKGVMEFWIVPKADAPGRSNGVNVSKIHYSINPTLQHSGPFLKPPNTSP